MGELNERLGDPLEAVREYERAALMDPSEQNYFEWGTELLLHRADGPAAEVFAKGSHAHPDSARMLAGFGAALYAEGKREEAAARLCEASDLQPADPAPYVFLGKMEKAATGVLACVEQKLARFAQEQPGNALANYYYGVTLWKCGRGSEKNAAGLQQAEALLEKTVNIDPKFGEAYLQLGILHSERGDFEQAIRDYKKAIELLNKGAEVCKKYGVRMSYHNHDFEFVPFDDGTTPFGRIALVLIIGVSQAQNGHQVLVEHAGGYIEKDQDPLACQLDPGDIATIAAGVPEGADLLAGRCSVQAAGLETALTLARAREIARATVFAGKKPGTPRSNITLGSTEMDTLIKDLFNLSLPDAPAERPRPPTPQTPTGRGTPTGGRNTPRLDIQTNGTGTPGHNAHRGGSVMSAYPPFSSHANFAAQVVPMGSTATQMEPLAAAGAANKATPISPSGPRPTQASVAVERTLEGAESVAGASNEPEPKEKEAAAAEASLDPVTMHLDVSKRDSMKKVVSDGHRSEAAATQGRVDIVETKKATQARGAASSVCSVMRMPLSP